MREADLIIRRVLQSKLWIEVFCKCGRLPFLQDLGRKHGARLPTTREKSASHFRQHGCLAERCNEIQDVCSASHKEFVVIGSMLVAMSQMVLGVGCHGEGAEVARSRQLGEYGVNALDNGQRRLLAVQDGMHHMAGGFRVRSLRHLWIVWASGLSQCSDRFALAVWPGYDTSDGQGVRPGMVPRTSKEPERRKLSRLD
jgi:hypothetical protein